MHNNCGPCAMLGEVKTAELDVDLEQLIRDSERLHVCEALFRTFKDATWELRDALTPILGAQRSGAAASANGENHA